MPAVAALIAVPSPLSNPVMLVDSVIAGVVVPVATVPAKPLADTTDTEVTVPVPPVAAIVIAPAPLVMLMFEPAVRVALVSVLPVVLPMSNCPSVKVVWPVPPLVTSRVEESPPAVPLIHL